MAITPRKFQDAPTAAAFADDDYAVGWRSGGTDYRWSAQQIASYVIGAAAATYVSLAAVGATSGVAALDAGGKVPIAQLPALAITNTTVCANEAAMLALDAQTGDVAIRTDETKSYVLAGDDPTDLADWQELITPTGGVGSVNGKSGAVTLYLSDLSDTTSYGRSIANAASASAARTLLGLTAAAVAGSASTTAEGIVELATDAETQTGTDTARAVTPASLTAKQASVTNWRSNDANRLLATNTVWSAAAEVSLVDGSTIAVDMSTFFNATVTLGGNRTLGQPSNAKVGQAGVIRIIQDGTGNRTLAFHSDWKFESSTDPVLSTGANAQDLLFYQVIAANYIFGALVKNVG